MFLIMGSVLPGYMFRYQYYLVGGLKAIVFGRFDLAALCGCHTLNVCLFVCLLLLLLLLLFSHLVSIELPFTP